MQQIKKYPTRSDILFLIMCLIAGTIISSCISPSFDRKWPNPNPPIKQEVTFVPIEYNGQRGVFISESDVIDLANNTKEQQRYAKDLEALIQSIKNYYKAN